MTPTRERTAYPPEWAQAELFEGVTDRALRSAREDRMSPAVARALRSLEDIRTDGGKQEHTGATYKSLAYAAIVSGADRRELTAAAERLGLTQKHVGHIIARARDHERELWEQAERGPIPPDAPPSVGLPKRQYETGERVLHERFGYGTVVEAGREKQIVRVNFDSGYASTFVPILAPMVKVPGEPARV